MTRHDGMDLGTFQQCLDVHGAEVEGWPASERDAGQRLLMASEEARRLREEAANLAQMLDLVSAPELSSHLMRRVAEIPLQHPRAVSGRRSWWPFETFSRPALAMAAAALMGIVTGSFTMQPWLLEEASQMVPEEEEAAWTSQDIDELSELAFAWHLDESGWDEGELP